MKKWVGIAVFLGVAWLIGAEIHATGQTHEAGASFIKRMLIPIAQVYLDLFNSPTTALVLCAAMVALAIGLFFYYFFARISPALHELEAVAVDLRQVPLRLGDPQDLASVNEIMTSHPLMARAWKLYHATLVHDENGRPASPFSPSRYLNMRALEHAGLKLRFFLGMPNDFVGLGLIFTFLGLVAGLYFASKSMLSADLADARNSLTMLLHAATFKFLTSITGIGISLVMAGAQRVILDKLQSGLDELQYLVEERIPPLETVQFRAARQEAAGAIALETAGEVRRARVHEVN